jgi:hypothetical protein
MNDLDDTKFGWICFTIICIAVAAIICTAVVLVETA